MSKLEELLKGVDMEWKSLLEISNIGTGNSNRQDEAEDGIYPFYVRSKKILKSNTYQFDEKAIVIPGEGGIGDIFHYVEGKYALHQRAYRININNKYILTKYVYYLMLNNFKQYIIKKSIGTTATSIRKPMLEKFRILIPCPDNPTKSLEIQQEIVRVLDELTDLTNQLKKELETERQNRKKQFEYYRESLYLFKGKNVAKEKMSEIGTFQRGKRFVRTDMISEGVPCIHYGEMYTHYGVWAKEAKSYLSDELVSSKKLRVAEKNDVVIVAAGETIEDIGKGTAWLGEEGVVIHDACFSYKSSLNPKYFAYYTRTIQFHNQIKRNISSGKISAINEKGFSKVIIPIPSPEEQERIVNLLDKFNENTMAVTKELENEINLTTKQYEYYREKLLTFK